MDNNVEFSHMFMPGGRKPSPYHCDSYKKNYMENAEKKSTEQHNAVQQSMSEPYLRFYENEHSKHFNFGDDEMFSRSKDGLGRSDEMATVKRLDYMSGVLRIKAAALKERQYSSGVSEKSERTNRLNGELGLRRSHPTLSEIHKEQDSLILIEECERSNMLNMVPSMRKSNPVLNDRRRHQDSLILNDECERSKMLNMVPSMRRSHSVLSDRRKQQDAFRKMIVKNWILVKDNSSPFSWWKEFKEIDFLPNSAFDDLDEKTKNIERRDLAELLLIKALQKDVCTSDEKIEVLKRIILKGLENELIHKKREHAHLVSDDKKLKDCFKRNKKEWEKCLNRQDVIKIKDHLLQEDFITFIDNEELVNDKDYYKRSKEHMFSQILEKVEENKDSFHCFIRHAENIISQKKSGQKLLQKITRQPPNRRQQVNRAVSITSKRERFAENKQHKGQHYTLSLKIKDENGKEEEGAYEDIKKQPDTVNVVMSKTAGAECDGISSGSVVIHFHPLDRDTCCTFDGNFVNPILMLVQEVIVKSKIPSGKYTLKAEVNVAHNLNKTAAEFKPLTDEINFVTAEKSFLMEEIDVDAVFSGLKMRNIDIESMNHTGWRKNNARDLLNLIIKRHLEDVFMDILREYKMTYILNRYETYMHVYKSETAVLRRNIIKKFSSILECIDIDDIRDVLLDLGVTKESTLNELVFEKFEDRRDFALATLIIEFLKSGNAIHAFAYALFLQEYNPLLVNNSPQKSQGISDADDENEIGTYSVGDNRQMYVGCFDITIGSEDVRDGAVVCNREKRLPFSVSASNIDFPVQRTNSGMINNRLKNSFPGFPASILSTRLHNEYQRDVLCRLSITSSSNRARTSTKNGKHKDYQRDISSRLSYADSPSRARNTTSNGQYKDYQRNISSLLSHAGSPSRARTTTTKGTYNEYKQDLLSPLANDGSSNRSRTTTPNGQHKDYQRDISSLLSYAGSPSRATKGPYNEYQQDLLCPLPNASFSNRARTTTPNGQYKDYQRDISSLLSYAGSPIRARTTTTKGQYIDYQRDISSLLSYAGSPSRARTTTTKDVGECDNDLRSDNAELSIISLSPRCTTCNANSGHSTQLEAEANTHSISLPERTIATTYSGDLMRLETDDNRHKISSSICAIGTADSGPSTELDGDNYKYQISSFMSNASTKDCVNSTKFKGYDETIRISSSMSTIGKTDAGHLNKLEEDDQTHRISASMSTIGTMDSGNPIQLEADDETHMINSSNRSIGTTDSGHSTQLEADDETYRISSSLSQICIMDSGHSSQRDAEDDTHSINSDTSTEGTKDSGDSTKLIANGKRHRIISPTSAIGTPDSGYSTQRIVDGNVQKIRLPADT